MTDGFRPGDVVTAASGAEYVIGEPIGLAADPDQPCDAPNGGSYMHDGGSVRCRCTVCPRCRHHTGNSHQGHYWGFCKVTKTTREFHFCCPDPAFGCELEEPGHETADVAVP